MKDELSNSVVEKISNPETQKEIETSTPEEVNTEVQQESVQNNEVINNEIIHEDKPKKSNKFTIVLIVIFIIGAIGGSVYYFNILNNTKKDNNHEPTTSNCDGDVCTISTISSESTSISSSASTSTSEETQVLRDYLSNLKESFDPFEGVDLLSSKYYEIKLDEYDKCNGNNDVSFDYKNHKISYKCITDDVDDDDPWYVAKGKIDNVKVSTGYDTADVPISCGSINFFGDDNTVVIHKVWDCDTMYTLSANITFYTKDGKLIKEIDALTFEMKYKNNNYFAHPYIIDNSLYYIPSHDNYIYNTDTNIKLHKLDLSTFEDTIIDKFIGTIITG